MKVAIIGTVGVPANYGGFETLVEQLVLHNNSDKLQYAVYCSTKNYKEKNWVYHGARIEYVGFNANGLQSIPYDIISLMRAAKKSDVLLILGVSGCAFLPLFRVFFKKRIIVNIDGLEHRRDKWNKLVRKFLKFSEKQAVKYADIIVADNKGITDYVAKEYGKAAVTIAYGGDQVLTTHTEEDTTLSRYGLTRGKYAMALCRIEPENNVHTILEAFAESGKKLVFIGNWNKSTYGSKLKSKYQKNDNLILLDAIYDLPILNSLRKNCEVYLHGHSAGGTNPSLVEAMFFRVPIIAFDCIYNRESTENKAAYFVDAESLKEIIKSTTNFITNAEAMSEIAKRRYRWNKIAKQYEALYS